MIPVTLEQAAILLVRFFGFYLLFFLPFNLTEFPSYWLRSPFSPLHPTARNSFDISYDVSFVMFCVRQVGHLVLGAFFFRRPQKLATLLLKHLGDVPPKLPV